MVVLAIADPQMPSTLTCNNEADGIESWAWSALILPFIEQGSLHDAMGIGRGDLLQNYLSDLAQQPIGTYKCPTDASPDPNRTIGNFLNAGISNYGAINAHRAGSVSGGGRGDGDLLAQQRIGVQRDPGRHQQYDRRWGMRHGIE